MSQFASLFDRLTEDEDERLTLRDAIRRDLQNLLNARSAWRAIPPAFAALRGTVRDYGLPDFTGAAFNAQEQREALRADILAAVAAFEPRLARVRVTLRASAGQAAPGIRLVIEAVLAGEDALPVAFETIVDNATSDLRLLNPDE
jgi:type VI secretion system protein ImpF